MITYNQKQNNDDFNLQQLLVCVLASWKRIIIGMIILGVILCVMKCGLDVLSMLDTDEVAKQQAKYENLVEYKEEQINASEERMETISALIDTQRNYLKDSIYMAIDSENVYRAEIRYFIKTDYEILPSMTYQNVDRTNTIVNTFAEYLNDSAFLSEVADSQNSELKYIQEIVKIYNAGDGVLAIDITADTETRLNELITILENKIANDKKSIAAMIEDFQISTLKKSLFTTADDTVQSTQQKKKDTLTDYMKEYTTEQETLKTLSETVIKNEAMTIKTLIKDGIKAGIVGAVIGAFFVVARVALSFLFGNTVYSARMLQEKFSIPVIGSFITDLPSKLKFDSWLRDCADKSTTVLNSDSIDIVAANIMNSCNSGDSILLTGTADETIVNQIAADLTAKLSDIHVIAYANLHSNSKAIRNLPDVSSVILIEQSGVSKYSNIEKEIQIASRYDRPIIGCVIIEN